MGDYEQAKLVRVIRGSVIDVIVDIRPTSDRRGNNIFSSYLAGVKTFADGAKKFLQVKILVA